MSEQSEDVVAPPINLPEGAVFSNAVTAVSYFDSEGHAAYLVSRSGRSSFLHELGLVEAAKAALIEQNQRRNDDTD